MRSGELGFVTVYGDLKGGFVANLANEPICKMMKLLICFRLMPMWPIFRCLRGKEARIFPHQAKRSRIGSSR
jgi:hypothetical protein